MIKQKRASLNLYVSVIVIIIISLLILVGLSSFFRESFVRISGVLERKIPVMPPVAVISNPLEEKHHMAFPIIFDGSGSYDDYYKIKKYYWDIDGDSKIDADGAIVNTSYTMAGYFNITLYVMNEKGAIGKTSKELHVFSSNIHPTYSYTHVPYSSPKGPQKPSPPEPPPAPHRLLFMIGDKTDTAESNWRDILRMVPLTRWNQMDGYRQYLFVVYHYTSTMINEDVVEILEDIGATTAVMFGDIPPDIVPGTVDGYTIANRSMNDYFSYWDPYVDIIAVDYDNKESGLIASLFASWLNAPMIFVNSGNLDDYKDLMDGKNLYIVGANGDNSDLDDGTMTWINDTNQSVIHYTEESLRNISINPYYALSSEVKFITSEVVVPPPAITYIDSDGGKDYYVKGNVTGLTRVT